MSSKIIKKNMKPESTPPKKKFHSVHSKRERKLALAVLIFIGILITAMMISSVVSAVNYKDSKQVSIELTPNLNLKGLGVNKFEEPFIPYQDLMFQTETLENRLSELVLSEKEETEVEEEIIEEVEKEPFYTQLTDTYENNLYWLSRIIYAECGSSYCTDELQLLTGSVVLNRVLSTKYPNSIYDVIFQHSGNSYQYSPAKSGKIYNEPDERCINNTKYLLENGPIEPNIIYQSGFRQGTITYKVVPIKVNGRHIDDMYFCY